ncbi:MAG TPA: hypothetical protein VEK11_12320 [Thermoanaerobaculia bacterium]|nr:hypothetical protein [Thermoanaerobaculia bacterium]
MTDPAPIHEHALSNLRYIRDAMERASAFTSIPGWGGVAVGVTAVAAAVVGHFAPTWRAWLLTWLIEAVVAGFIAGVTMFRKARKAHVSFSGGPARRFFVSYFAPIFAGAVLTLLLTDRGYFEALAPMWLLVYGASTVSSGAYSIPVVPVMGICSIILGIAACFGGFAVQNALMGAGFGGLHVVFGLVIARRYGG